MERGLCGRRCALPEHAADERLWRPSELAPADLGRKALAVQDDVEFRQAVRALRTADLEDAVISDPRWRSPQRGPGPAGGRSSCATATTRDGPEPRVCSRSSGSPASSTRPRSERPSSRPRSPTSRSRSRSIPERRGEVQPRARLPARTRPRAERGIGRIQRRPWWSGLEGRRRRPARQRILAGPASSSRRPVLLALGVLSPRRALLRAPSCRTGTRRCSASPTRARADSSPQSWPSSRRGVPRYRCGPARDRADDAARTRTDAEAFVVLDVSRSMLARRVPGRRSGSSARKRPRGPSERRSPRFGSASRRSPTERFRTSSRASTRRCSTRPSPARSGSSSLPLARRWRRTRRASTRSPRSARQRYFAPKRASDFSSCSPTASRSRSPGRGSRRSCAAAGDRRRAGALLGPGRARVRR